MEMEQEIRRKLILLKLRLSVWASMFLRYLRSWRTKSAAFRENGDKNETSYPVTMLLLELLGCLGDAKIPSRKSPPCPEGVTQFIGLGTWLSYTHTSINTQANLELGLVRSLKNTGYGMSLAQKIINLNGYRREKERTKQPLP